MRIVDLHTDDLGHIMTHLPDALDRARMRVVLRDARMLPPSRDDRLFQRLMLLWEHTRRYDWPVSCDLRASDALMSFDLMKVNPSWAACLVNRATWRTLRVLWHKGNLRHDYYFDAPVWNQRLDVHMRPLHQPACLAQRLSLVVTHARRYDHRTIAIMKSTKRRNTLRIDVAPARGDSSSEANSDMLDGGWRTLRVLTISPWRKGMFQELYFDAPTWDLRRELCQVNLPSGRLYQ